MKTLAEEQFGEFGRWGACIRMAITHCDARHNDDVTGEWLCSHPSIFAPENVVSAAICRSCPFLGKPIAKTRLRTLREHKGDLLLRLQTIAVVIPCHNYGRFLSKSIESALGQSMPPYEIIVLVDRSTDDSLDVARRYRSDGVQTIVVNYGNVHNVRRRGYEETTSDVICFLDADDYLGPEYLASGLSMFGSHQVGIVYSDMQQFGANHERLEYPVVFSRAALSRQNYIHAGSLVRRDALTLSGCFDTDLDPKVASCTGDWWLWQCVARSGWKARKQNGLYYYRRHSASALATVAGTLSYFELSCLDQEMLTLFIPLSGRTHLWSYLRDFLEEQEWPHAQIALTLLDTSQDTSFARTVRLWAATCDYGDVRYISRRVAAPELADAPRLEHADSVRAAMARIYNLLRTEVSTSYVWILEDDVDPPRDVAKRLLSLFDESTGSVAAPYRSRFHSDYVVWDEAIEPVSSPQRSVTNVGGNGFGCTILRAELLEETLFSHAHRVPDFDHAFYQVMRKSGLIARVNWEVECRHYDTNGLHWHGERGDLKVHVNEETVSPTC